MKCLPNYQKYTYVSYYAQCGCVLNFPFQLRIIVGNLVGSAKKYFLHSIYP